MKCLYFFIVFVLIWYSAEDAIPFTFLWSRLKQVWGYRRSRGPACKHKITKVVLPKFKQYKMMGHPPISSLRLWFKPAVVSRSALISFAGNNNPHNFPKGQHTCACFASVYLTICNLTKIVHWISDFEKGAFGKVLLRFCVLGSKQRLLVLSAVARTTMASKDEQLG